MQGTGAGKPGAAHLQQELQDQVKGKVESLAQRGKGAALDGKQREQMDKSLAMLQKQGTQFLQLVMRFTVSVESISLFAQVRWGHRSMLRLLVKVLLPVQSLRKTFDLNKISAPIQMYFAWISCLFYFDLSGFYLSFSVMDLPDVLEVFETPLQRYAALFVYMWMCLIFISLPWGLLRACFIWDWSAATTEPSRPRRSVAYEHLLDFMFWLTFGGCVALAFAGTPVYWSHTSTFLDTVNDDEWCDKWNDDSNVWFNVFGGLYEILMCLLLLAGMAAAACGGPAFALGLLVDGWDDEMTKALLVLTLSSAAFVCLLSLMDAYWMSCGKVVVTACFCARALVPLCVGTLGYLLKGGGRPKAWASLVLSTMVLAALLIPLIPFALVDGDQGVPPCLLTHHHTLLCSPSSLPCPQRPPPVLSCVCSGPTRFPTIGALGSVRGRHATDAHGLRSARSGARQHDSPQRLSSGSGHEQWRARVVCSEEREWLQDQLGAAAGVPWSGAAHGRAAVPCRDICGLRCPSGQGQGAPLVTPPVQPPCTSHNGLRAGVDDHGPHRCCGTVLLGQHSDVLCEIVLCSNRADTGRPGGGSFSSRMRRG